MILKALVFSLLCVQTFPASAQDAPYNSEQATTAPLSAEDAARQWKWPEGFTTTVFAAEPDVQQPIAMALDARGRLWVAECYSYAEARIGWAAQLKDRIIILEDTDGDGRHDRRTVFCEGLEKLTSLEIGFGGVWAITLPSMVFIPDANADDRPDGPPVPKLDGFEWQVNHHTVANGLRWGPDGWLYGRHGIQAVSLLGRPGTPEAARMKMNVGIWRYHPQQETVETVCSGTTNPWGMDWNEFGDAFFINTVIGHLWQVIPGAHYRRMYGQDLNPNVYEIIEQHADHVHWAGGESWNDWQKLGITDATSAAGGGHAHTGLLFYSGGTWPEAWQGNLLTVNFNGRRINVEHVVPQGSGYVGKRLPDTGFAADPFFRGIDLLGAADGGVFIADWSDTGECHDDSGVHRLSGRIYKVAYGQEKARAAGDIRRLSPNELLPLLDGENEYPARQARLRLQELAVAGADLSAVKTALLRKFQDDSNTVHKLRALWALYAIGAADSGLLRASLQHPEAHVRAWAIRLLVDDAAVLAGDTATHEALKTAAASETSAPVRLALIAALQRLPDAARLAIAPLLLNRAEDAADHNLPQMLWYALEPLGTSNPAALAELLKVTAVPLVRQCIVRRLMASDSSAMELLLAYASQAAAPVQQDVLQGMALALQGQRGVKPPAGWAAAAGAFNTSADAAVRDRFRQLGAAFADPLALQATRAIVLDSQAPAEERRAALRTLVEARAEGLRGLCESVLAQPPLLTTAASGLALDGEPGAVALILKHYPTVPAEERTGLISVLISRPAWAALVLDAATTGIIPRTDISAFHARQMRAYRDPVLTKKLATVWGEVRESPADKLAKIAGWKSRLTAPALAQADKAKGRTIFKNLCSTCHMLNGEGGKVGPELTGSNRDNLDYLLQNITDPGSVVAREYQLTTLTLKDARVMAGFIRGKTDKTVTLQTLAEPITIPVNDIATTEIAPVSLMPDGLLDALSETDARDLISYLMAK